MKSVQWLNLASTYDEIAAQAKEHLEVDLHPSAIEHLQHRPGSGHVPFPRLENHLNYLFGAFHIPSNNKNLEADFDRVAFVATHDKVLATISTDPTSTIDWNQVQDDLSTVDSTDTAPDGGQFIINLLRFVISNLTVDGRTLERYLSIQITAIFGSLDLSTHKAEEVSGSPISPTIRRERLRKLRNLGVTTAELARLLPRMRRVGSETQDILKSLVADDPMRDLHRDIHGVERQLFSAELEIFLRDVLIDARKMNATLDDCDALLEKIREKSISLNAEEHEAAGRFTGAIASIMLLPTFIVGLYGQNFSGQMPELEWEYGYLSSWFSIIAVTIFQVAFFKRRRWI